jgi:hypothetical protein
MQDSREMMLRKVRRLFRARGVWSQSLGERTKRGRSDNEGEKVNQNH